MSAELERRFWFFGLMCKKRNGMKIPSASTNISHLPYRCIYALCITKHTKAIYNRPYIKQILTLSHINTKTERKGDKNVNGEQIYTEHAVFTTLIIRYII